MELFGHWGDGWKRPLTAVSWRGVRVSADLIGRMLDHFLSDVTLHQDMRGLPSSAPASVEQPSQPRLRAVNGRRLRR